MKKIIGKIGTYSLFYLGHWTSEITHWKIYGEFVFDKNDILMWIGGKLHDIYKWSMISSVRVQDWAKLDGPWTKTEENADNNSETSGEDGVGGKTPEGQS